MHLYEGQEAGREGVLGGRKGGPKEVRQGRKGGKNKLKEKDKTRILSRMMVGCKKGKEERMEGKEEG